MYVAIESWLVLYKQTASSSSELRGEGPLVCLAWGSQVKRTGDGQSCPKNYVEFDGTAG